MSKNEEPDWLGELAKGGEAVRRQVEPIVQAAEQFVCAARLAKARGRLALPLAQRVALAVDAGLRELLPCEPVVHHITLGSAITASGGLALQSPRIVALGEVGTGIDTLAVEVLDSCRGLATLNDGEILFLVLVWLYALVLPWLGTALPPEFHAMMTDGYATIGIALAITWRILDKKR